MIERCAHIHVRDKQNAVESALSTSMQDNTAPDLPELSM
jgi:hypothetical protein